VFKQLFAGKTANTPKIKLAQLHSG